MKKILLVILLSITFNIAHACGERPVSYTMRQDGSKYGLFINKESIKKSRQWIPSEGKPPLSVSAAYNRVITWAKGKYKRYDKVMINEITLKKYRCSGITNYWYYQINITPVIGGNEIYALREATAVLMNGLVIGHKKF